MMETGETSAMMLFNSTLTPLITQEAFRIFSSLVSLNTESLGWQFNHFGTYFSRSVSQL
jgi:hypothetical protein